MELAIVIVAIMVLCYVYVKIIEGGMCMMCGGRGKHRKGCPADPDNK